MKHELFFVRQFDPETNEDEDEADDSAEVTLIHHRSSEHGEKAGINRMTHERYGPRTINSYPSFKVTMPLQFVPRTARARGTDCESANTQNCGGGKNGVGVRNNAEIERCGKPLPAKEKKPTDNDWYHVTESLKGRLAINCALGKKGGYYPDKEKRAPTDVDDYFGERSHSDNCESEVDPIKMVRTTLRLSRLVNRSRAGGDKLAASR